MSSAASPIRTHTTGASLSWSTVFGGALVALFVLEASLLRERFSTDVLDMRTGPCASFVRSTRHATPFALACAGAIFAIGGATLRRELVAVARAFHPPHRLWPYALAHGCALFAFHALSAALLEGGPYGLPSEGILTLAWCASAVAVPVSLAASGLSLRDLARCAHRLRFTLALGFAAGAFGFALYRISESTWPFWQPLSHGTVVLAHAIAAPFLTDCTVDASQYLLRTPAFAVVVTKYCSGYEGIGLFAIFFSGFLAIARDRLRFPHALLLLPLGCGAMWILNAVRVAALVAIGTLVSPEAAIEGFHVYAGWPLVATVALTCVAVSTRVAFFSSLTRTHAEQPGSNPTVPYLTPLLALVATALVSGAFTDDPAELYPLRIVAALAVLGLNYDRYACLRATSTVAPLLFGALAWALWIGLDAPASAPWSNVSALDGPESIAAIGARIAFGCLGSFAVAPLVEELFFRGYVYRRLVSRHFERADVTRLAPLALLASSVAFGLVHEHWVAATAAGCVYALAYARRGRLLDAVVAHGVTNLLLALQATVFASGP